MDYMRWNLKLPSLCQKTMTSKTTAPYLRLHQNDKLRIPTYQASNTHLTSCPAHFENVRNFGLKHNTTDDIYYDSPQRLLIVPTHFCPQFVSKRQTLFLLQQRYQPTTHRSISLRQPTN